MGSSPVVVRAVSDAEDQDAVGEFGPGGEDESFGEAVRARTTRRDRMASDPSAVTGGLPLVGAACSATVRCVKDPPVDLRPPLLTMTARPAADARFSSGSFVSGPNRSIELSRSSTASPPDGTFPPQSLAVGGDYHGGVVLS